MNYLLTLDTNLVEVMIAPKVIELRKDKDEYIKNNLIDDMQDWYMGDIYEDVIYKIENIIDGGFAKKYECVEYDGESEVSFVDYDGNWHIDCGYLNKLEEHWGIMITTKYGKYLMLHFLQYPNKINKFKCKYKDCFKIEWINDIDLVYNSDSDDE